MGLKTAGVGHFMIPTAPAAGIAVAQSASANTYGTLTQIIASTAAALYITGVYVEVIASTNLPTYVSVEIAVTASTIVDIMNVPLGPTSGVSSTQWGTYKPIFPYVPVATATKILAATASSVASAISYLITLECIAQTNVVDDGIAQTANVTQLLGTAWLTPGTAGTPDVNTKLIGGQTASASGTITFPNATLASTTNLTAGTIATVTNQLTAAAIATGVWQDATAGDFTTASSIGKALYIANVAPGASGGHMISGSNAGTTTLGALTVTGATTLTGNAVLSDGLTISAPSTLNRAGLSVAGNGTGAGMSVTGGATGIGLAVIGGGTSGDGLKLTTTSGHGINSAPVGTNMHGILATGGNGGTSDGIKGAAGTGGVDVRGNITGNITGTLATLTTYTGNTPQTGDSFARIGVAGAGLTALGDTHIANLDATVSSRMATYTQPTGFLAATFPSGTVANTTNITAGTITTATNLTTNNDKTGYALSSAGVQAIWDALTSALTTVGSIGKSIVTNLDAAISTRLASGSYTAPDNASVTAIKAKTDSLTFTVAGKVDGNIKAVNDTTVAGVGTAGSPWGP